MKPIRTLILLCIAVTASTLSARQLSPDEALRRAMGDASRAAAVGNDVAPSLAYTATDSLARPMAYVFTQGAGRGYMVVSADDVALPLLGYADSGTFEADRIPSNMLAWLEGYAAEIAWASERAALPGAEDLPVMKGASRPYRAPVAPLVTTRWNQSAPFNNMCPTYNGYRCVTGCVATAMAQVMNYHQWPEQGVGAHEYTTTSTGLHVGWNFEELRPDWENMADTYDSNSSAASKNAVAELMAAIGVAVEMNYTPSMSGTPSSTVATALRDYFNYDVATEYRYRAWYGLYDWEDLIYNELTTVGPVYYDGLNISAGHAFVCDGYSADGYFHFNWGWGGTSDGYFRLTALDPESQGIGGSTAGYNYQQGIVTGVRPPQPGSRPMYFLGRMRGEFGVAKNNIVLGRSVTFTGGLSNVTYRNIPAGTAVTAGVRLTNTATGDETILVSTNVMNYTGGLDSYSGWSGFDVTLPSTLSVGDYEVKQLYRIDDGEWQDVVDYHTFFHSSLYMTVAGNVATFSTVAPGFRITEVKCSPLYKGKSFKITAKYSNPGDKEFQGGICATFLYTDSNNEQWYYSYGRVLAMDVQPGESGEIEYVSDFYMSDEKFVPGEYELVFMDYRAFQYGRDKTYSEPVVVTVSDALDEKTELFCYQSDIDVSAVKTGSVTKVNLTVDVACSKGLFTDKLLVAIFDGNTNIGQTQTDNIFIAKGEREKVTVSMAVENMDVGKTYNASIYYGSSYTSWAGLNGVNVTVTESSGIDEVEAPDEDTPVEYFNLQGMPVNPDNLRPGQIYIRRSGTTATKIRY